MINTPQTIQLPLYEPMYINGHLSPVWASFFDSIIALLNASQLADLITLMQLASQLPDQSKQGQTALDMAHLADQFSSVIANQSDQAQLGVIPITQQQNIELQPLQAVFLCANESLTQVSVPQFEVITP